MARLQHVTVPIPEGGPDEGRSFYACVPGRPRFYTTDPFGNLVEVMQIVADYQAA